MKTVVDLFAGCGGMSMGFQNAGYELIGAFENWDVAANCYEANFAHPVYRTDLSDTESAIDELKSLHPDIIIGGPPCQDFSHAGKRIEDKRASLTKSFASIIDAIRSKVFVMENVDRAFKSQAYGEARKVFKAAGYGLTERVLTASYCGVPQRRKRFFCIGIMGESDGSLDSVLDERMSEEEMTVRDYFGDSLDTEFYYRHPRNYARRAVFSIDEPAPTMRGVNRPIPQGYPGHPKDAHRIDESVRPLTALERSLIQTFPPEFKWIGSKTDREQMIGNAVPVKLAQFVAEAIHDSFERSIAPSENMCEEEFVSWLQETKGYQARTARSTLSNLHRVEFIMPFTKADTTSMYLAKLNEAHDFTQLTPSVRSHLRSAAKLYFEFSVA